MSSTPLLPSFHSLSEFRNATPGQFFILGILGLVVLRFAYGYLKGWWSDPLYSLATLSVSLLAGGAVLGGIVYLNNRPPTIEPIDGAPFSLAIFLCCHLFYHFSGRCKSCGAHRWRIDSVYCEAVGERTVTRRRERVSKHFDSSGNLVGTTKENEDVPETQPIYEQTWMCRRCDLSWTTKQ
jgi:hypothetical protein